MSAWVRLAPLLVALAACAAPAPGSASAPAPGSAPAPAPASASASASAPAPGAASAPAPAPAAAPARRASLRFALGDRPFPSPLVDALVSGQPTTLLVDTGASHHVVATWLVEELALPLRAAGDTGVDHAGQAVQVSRLDGAKLAVSGWGAIDAQPLLVIAVPDALRRAGIGGVLAPQALVTPGRAVIVDLRAGVLGEAPLEEAFAATPAGAGAAELTVCGGPEQGRQLLAAASVEGLPVKLMVDSGMTQTSLFAGSDAGARLAKKAKGTRSAYTASGKHTVPVARGARASLGGREVEADVDVLPGAPRAACPADGFAGMDLLRDCVLVLGEARAALRCDAGVGR